MKPFLKKKTLALAVVVLLAAGSLHAWEPTDGIVLPVPSIVEQDEPVALEVNPANLGFLNSWSLMFLGSYPVNVEQQDITEGGGYGLYFGSHVFGPLSVGTSLDLLFPSDVQRQVFGLDERYRFSLGAALRLTDGLSFGFAYRHIFSEYAFGLDGLDTADFGLSLRPANWLGFALTVRDIATPQVITRLGNLEVNRRWAFGTTIRPLARDILSVGAEVIFSDIDNTIDVRSLIGLNVVDGLELRLGSGFLNVDEDVAYTIEGAIALNFAPFGAGFGTAGRVEPNPYMVSYSWWARVSGMEYASLWEIKRIPVIDISESDSTYDFARQIRLLENMAHDDDVEAVLIRPSGEALPLAIAQDYRRRISALREAGKSVICHLNGSSGSAYYACAGADRILINPAGGVRLTGIKASKYYLADLMDKIGVKADIVRIGRYKSSPEMFTQTGPTDSAQEALDSLLSNVYGHFVSDIARDRGIDQGKLAEIIDSGPFVAKEALEAGLVDELVYNDELEEAVWRTLGSESPFDEDYGSEIHKPQRWLKSPKVAVIHIEGTMVDGESMTIPFWGYRTAGAATLTRTLREVAKSDDIKAVVLRIDSPGGSALAADILWREIMAVRKHKPVIASMGSVAASGAYYIASAADEIFAESATITGSIGIFYGKADVSGLLDKIGVNVAITKRGARADMESWFRPYTDDERNMLQKKIGHFYNMFLDKVVEGRGRGFNSRLVDELGRGRVWSGAQAHWHLLVDRIGGLSEATSRARHVSKIRADAPVIDLPERRTLLEQLYSEITKTVSTDEAPAMFPIPAGLKSAVKAVLPFVSVAQNDAPLALLPFTAEIR